MLTAAERFQVLKVLRSFANWNLFPIQVDAERWELRPGAGKQWKTLDCSLSYGLFVANTSYKVGSLLYVLLVLRETPLHQVMVHTTVAVATAVMVFWYYVIFVKHADLHAKVFKATLTGRIEEDEKGELLLAT